MNPRKTFCLQIFFEKKVLKHSTQLTGRYHQWSYFCCRRTSSQGTSWKFCKFIFQNSFSVKYLWLAASVHINYSPFFLAISSIINAHLTQHIEIILFIGWKWINHDKPLDIFLPKSSILHLKLIRFMIFRGLYDNEKWYRRWG